MPKPDLIGHHVRSKGFVEMPLILHVALGIEHPLNADASLIGVVGVPVMVKPSCIKRDLAGDRTGKAIDRFYPGSFVKPNAVGTSLTVIGHAIEGVVLDVEQLVGIGVDSQVGAVKVAPFGMLKHDILREIAVPGQEVALLSLPFPVTAAHATKRNIIVNNLYHHIRPADGGLKLRRRVDGAAVVVEEESV